MIPYFCLNAVFYCIYGTIINKISKVITELRKQKGWSKTDQNGSPMLRRIAGLPVG
jgi:hypothetical protein